MNVLQRAAVYVFVGLTAAVFLGPAAISSVPHPAQAGLTTALEGLSLALLAMQVALLLVIGLAVLWPRRRGRISALTRTTLLLAGSLAIANAVRLALGFRWQGFAADLAGSLWFAAPLGLLAVAFWPRTSQRDPRWWEGGWKALLLAFPVAFVLAGLARVDLRTPFGVVPLPVAWVLAYGPTLIGITLALAGWAFVVTVLRSPGRTLAEAGVLALGAAGVALLVSRSSLTAFVLSATITWGSGYQLFTAPFPLPPLIVSLTLSGAAFLAFALATVNVLRTGKSALGMAMALAVVLSGIFPTPLSILGSLAALELGWWTTHPITQSSSP